MKLKIFSIFIFAVLAAVAIFGMLVSESRTGFIEDTNSVKQYNRIISLAPNITEILYAIGLGDKVIGVSQYCEYPAEAATKPKFGGLMNPNYEAVMAAKPDLVIATEEMFEPENKFTKLGIETLGIKHDTINQIFESMLAIGKKCGREAESKKSVAELKRRVETIRSAYSKNSKPKVLICIGHKITPNADDMLENIYIAGDDGFYSEMLNIIGATNAYSGNIAFPKVGYESIIVMNPDIIIDTMSFALAAGFDKDIVVAQWKNFADIKAVENNRIYVLGESYMAIPGPRFILTLEKLANAIFQESGDINQND